MTISSFFRGTGSYYINLDRRPDLNEQAKAQFRKVGIRSERIAGWDIADMEGEFASNGPKGHLGCRISHNIAITLAKFRDLPAVLVFEDDVMFKDDFHEMWNKAEPNIPDDWDILFLSCRSAPENYEHISGTVYRVKDAVLGHAYAVRQKAYEPYLLRMATTLGNQDRVLGSLSDTLNVYAIKPSLAYQSAHYSETDYRNQQSVGL